MHPMQSEAKQKKCKYTLWYKTSEQTLHRIQNWQIIIPDKKTFLPS